MRSVLSNNGHSTPGHSGKLWPLYFIVTVLRRHSDDGIEQERRSATSEPRSRTAMVVGYLQNGVSVSRHNAATCLMPILAIWLAAIPPDYSILEFAIWLAAIPDC